MDEASGGADEVRPTRWASAPDPGSEVASHYRWCIGCGVDHPGGLHLRVHAGPDLTMTAELLVTEFHQGAPGLAHGGVIATAMDEAQGMLNLLLGVPAVTARLEVDFRRPVPVGRTLDIRMRVDGQRGRRVTTSAEAHLRGPEGEQGDVAVRSRAVFVQVPVEHFLDHGDPDLVARAVEDRRRGGPSWGREVNP